jgi:hypothetical protein
VNSPLPSRGWLRADPGLLERFADELDHLVGELCRVRPPQTGPPPVRVATCHDPPAGTIEELRTQAAAARAAAHDIRELELTKFTRPPKPDR